MHSSTVPNRRAARAGFTLIEVMVATAILLVMVVMIGNLFRQATSAWDAGYTRSEGGMVVRSVIGALEHDLASVVDTRTYEDGNPVQVSDSGVEFYCFKESTRTGERGLHLIKYTGGTSVTRTDTLIEADGSKGSSTSIELCSGKSTNSDTENNASYTPHFSFHVVGSHKEKEKGYSTCRYYEKGGDDNDAVPDFDTDLAWTGLNAIKVSLTLERSGRYAGLQVRSYGPDGFKNGENTNGKQDDIIVD